MVAVAPIAILLGAVVAIGLLFTSFSEPLFARIGKLGSRFEIDLEAAGMRMEPQHFVFVLAGVSLTMWVLLLMVVHPAPQIAV